MTANIEAKIINKEFLNFLTIEVMTEGSQSLIFQSNRLLHLLGFQLRSRWKTSSPNLLRNKTSNMDKNRNK